MQIHNKPQTHLITGSNSEGYRRRINSAISHIETRSRRSTIRIEDRKKLRQQYVVDIN